MDWKIIVIIILVCQFPLSVMSLIKLFKLNLKKTPSAIWNVTIMAIPFLGAAVFWSVLGVQKILSKRKNREEVSH
ncbi:hypothetical protein EOM82_03605 [bacterium]|nr:hypothetical protein [bacterium]